MKYLNSLGKVCTNNTRRVSKDMPWHRQDVKWRTSKGAATVMRGSPIPRGLASGYTPDTGAKDPYTNDEAAVYGFVAQNLSNQGKDRSKWQPVNRNQRMEPRRVGSPAVSFKEYITKYPKGYFVCYGCNQAHDHDHKTCERAL